MSEDAPAADSPSAARARFRSISAPLAVALAAAVLAGASLALGGVLASGDPHELDQVVLRRALMLRDAHPWLTDAMRDLSGLGSRTVLTVFVVGTVGYLLLVGRRTTGWLVGASALSGALLVPLLKAAFGRLRPDGAFAGILVEGLAYPSGHATMSAAIYLTLGALLAATRRRGQERVYVLAVAAGLAALVGASRVVLGVHWLTDVLGGWAFGSAWALAWLALDHRLRRRPDPCAPTTPRSPTSNA